MTLQAIVCSYGANGVFTWYDIPLAQDSVTPEGIILPELRVRMPWRHIGIPLPKGDTMALILLTPNTQEGLSAGIALAEEVLINGY